MGSNASAVSTQGTFRAPGPWPEVEAVFRRLDADGDGWLTRGELELVSFGRLGTARDFDGDGRISAQEFERSFREVYDWRPVDRFPLTQGPIGEVRRLMELGHLDKALAGARQVVEQFPEWAGGWGLLGVALSQVDQHDQARRACRKAVELAPNDDGAWFFSALSLAGTERTTEAAEALGRGLELLKVKIDLFGYDSVPSRDFDFDRQLCDLMETFLFSFQCPSEALRIGDWAKQHFGVHPGVEARRLTAMAMLGRQAEAASEAARLAAGTTAGRHHYLAAEGRILLRMDRPREAIAVLEQALALAEDPGERRGVRMDLLAALEAAGDAAAAARILEQVLAEAGTPLQKLAVAQMLIETGSPAKAVPLLEEVVIAAGGVPTHWMMLVQARAAMQDRAGCISALERGLARCESAAFREDAASLLASIRQGGPLPAGPGGPPGR
jgi:tetratricopeptide (TPR) repeat protein